MIKSFLHSMAAVAGSVVGLMGGMVIVATISKKIDQHTKKEEESEEA